MYYAVSRDAAGNQNLPRIPPFSGMFGLEARSDLLDLRSELEFAGAQNKVSDFELPTDGYAVVNTFVTLRPFSNARQVSIRLAGLNLNNEEVRLHTSFLKDLTPLPGRNHWSQHRKAPRTHDFWQSPCSPASMPERSKRLD